MDQVSATLIIPRPADAVFAVLCDPSKHVSIDGTGWVCESLDGQPITGVGQHFLMRMYHPNHPDGHYTIANRVDVFEPPLAIQWTPGYYLEDGSWDCGGWHWGYSLAPVGDGTEVTHIYDWSAVSPATRDHIGFPPFPPDHLANSLAHLAELVG